MFSWFKIIVSRSAIVASLFLQSSAAPAASCSSSIDGSPSSNTVASARSLSPEVSPVSITKGTEVSPVSITTEVSPVSNRGFYPRKKKSRVSLRPDKDNPHPCLGRAAPWGFWCAFRIVWDEELTFVPRVKHWALWNHIAGGYPSVWSLGNQGLVEGNIPLVPGHIVESGVWKGGSALMMILAEMTRLGGSFARLNSTEGREFFFFDTYEGMPWPGEERDDPTSRCIFEHRTTEELKIRDRKMDQEIRAVVRRTLRHWTAKSDPLATDAAVAESQVADLKHVTVEDAAAVSQQRWSAMFLVQEVPSPLTHHTTRPYTQDDHIQPFSMINVGTTTTPQLLLHTRDCLYKYRFCMSVVGE